MNIITEAYVYEEKTLVTCMATMVKPADREIR
jgi:hypothetical protein